jgi:hypothetical protein
VAAARRREVVRRILGDGVRGLGEEGSRRARI